MFYGLAIFHAIRNRKHRKKEDTKKVRSSFPRRKHLFTSYLLATPVLVLTAAVLIIKWSLLQPIHDELVDKFHNDTPLFYEVKPICSVTHSADFNVITVPSACFLVVIFAILTKRMTFLRRVCHGYGALPIPVDFFTHVDRKFIGVVFAIAADELFDIARSVFIGETKEAEGIMLAYLLRITDVLIIGLRYYPILAALYIKSISTLMLGALYAWLIFILTVVNQGMCDTSYYPTAAKFNETDEGAFLKDLFGYFGTGSTLLIIELVTDIPRYLCMAYICVIMPTMVISKVLHRLRPKKILSHAEQIYAGCSREERVLLRVSEPDSVEMRYIRNLLRPANRVAPSRCWLPKLIYAWRDDFHHSSRVVGMYSSICLLLFFIVVEVFMRVMPRLHSLRETIQSFTDDFVDVGLVDSNKVSKYRIPDLTRLFLLAWSTTIVVISLQLLVSLANIRRNLLQLFRGDDSEIPRRRRSEHVSYSVHNVHFAGYFIGYLIWGCSLVAVMAVLLFGAVEAFVVFGNIRMVERAVKYSIPSSLFLYLKQYLNKFLSQYVFLHDAGESISVNHRRLLMIYIYLSFFLDAFLGVLSAVLRVTKSTIGGIVYMCRMDYSPLGRKLESFDGGFMSYCGFVHMECAHRHPILLVFTAHLLSLRKRREHGLNGKSRSQRAARRWHLGLFLCRNPTIVFFRKAYLKQLHLDEMPDDCKNVAGESVFTVIRRRASSSLLSVLSRTSSLHVDRDRF